MKIIYKYVNLLTNRVCYVGQTININDRRHQHEEYEAFTEKRDEYNYPLSCAIRKYGVENFRCDIIEIVPLNLADEREIYWISYYDTYNNGYNQTPGGKVKGDLSSDDISDIYQFLREGKTYQWISDRKNISITLISQINNGNAYYNPEIQYPICAKKYGKRLDTDIVDSIREDLIIKQKTIRELAEIYNVGFNVIVRINNGESYYNENYTYPLRKGRARKKVR